MKAPYTIIVNYMDGLVEIYPSMEDSISYSAGAPMYIIYEVPDDKNVAFFQGKRIQKYIPFHNVRNIEIFKEETKPNENGNT